MRRFLPGREHVRRTFALSVPVVVVQVGLQLMMVVDTVMAGHVSERVLGSVALGGLYVGALLMFGLGVLLALDPVIAQAVGAGDQRGVARGFQRGLALAALVTIPVSAAILPVEWVLEALGQQPDLVPGAAEVARISLGGMFPFFGFVVLRSTLQSQGRLRPIVLTVVAANALNVLLNWALIFGNLGAPAMGLHGAALATTVSRWVNFLGLGVLSWPLLRPLVHARIPGALRPAPLLRLLGLGLPIAAQIELEWGAFAVVGLLMGRLGTTQLAAHQVALSLAALTFMLPLGISQAGAVLVGRAVGSGSMDDARRSAGASLALAVGCMLVTTVAYVAFPTALSSLYTRDAEVVALAATLLPIAGIFQLFDGTQVAATGVLRGAADVRFVMAIHLVGFWGVGVPVSVWLGAPDRAGAAGLWWGLVAGLTAVAVSLVVRVRKRLSSDIARVDLDDAAA